MAAADFFHKDMVLYHGAGYDNDILQPGYNYTGVVKNWDHTESNRWLYATSDKETAINLGFAGAVDRHYGLERFQMVDKNLVMAIQAKDKDPSMDELLVIDVWLYTIALHTHDAWVQVHNKHNGISNEWKTTRRLAKERILSKNKIDLKAHLSGVSVILNQKLISRNPKTISPVSSALRNW